MNKKDDIKEKITSFRDDLKKYYDLCLKYNNERKFIGEDEILLHQQEERNLSENLVERWGELEKIFIRIGADITSITPAIGIPEKFFDESLRNDSGPYKFRYLSLAIHSASKAIGLITSMGDQEIEKIMEKIPVLFISYHISKENNIIIEQLKDFTNSFQISVITGTEPETDSLSEKEKRLIDESDYLLAILTKDEEKKDGSWIPSKWVSDEIAYSIGLNKKIIRIVEKGLYYKPAISGDAEYITFDRNNISETIIKLAKIYYKLTA